MLSAIFKLSGLNEVLEASQEAVLPYLTRSHDITGVDGKKDSSGSGPTLDIGAGSGD
ncbi:MAG TPA: hypothetical protein PK513_06895 [Alphaproteobacteria bacterium]|nr:hypothetical protein [Alphaproteobacteria bacterium]HOO82212.1 hypothetical protein [Alphaproteobacteria bacterium]